MKAVPRSRFVATDVSPAQLPMSSSVPTGVHRRCGDGVATTCQKASAPPGALTLPPGALTLLTFAAVIIGPPEETNSSLSWRQSPGGAELGSTTETLTKGM